MSAPLRRFIRNIFYVSASIVGAVLLVRLGTVEGFLASVGGLPQVGSFIAGMFFTSVFTTAPSIAVLGELSLSSPLWVVALFGGIGAVVGDYILFLIVRDGLSKDVKFLLAHVGVRRFRKIFHTRFMHQLLPLFGALILASPLPDELGLALLGFSKINKDRFLLISLAMNSFGIFLIGLIARSLST